MATQIIQDTIGNYHVKSATYQDILDLAANILESRSLKGDVLSSPDAVCNFLQLKLAGMEREGFAVMFLDNRHKLISFEIMFYGTINGSSVHPREVAKRALELNAAAVIYAHNHPSGDTTPSNADKTITNKLIDVLNTFDIRTLDHIIVSNTGTLSFAETGLI